MLHFGDFDFYALLPFIAVAIMWLVPDRRVERYLKAHPETLSEDDAS